MGALNWLKNTAKNVGNVFFDDLIETEKERKEKEAKALQMPSSVMKSGRDEEGRSMATYGNNTWTSSNVSNNAGATASLVKGRGTAEGGGGIPPQYTPSYGGVSYKPKQPKSSFEQWNIEKTQPKLSYGQEKLIRSYNSAGSPWLDASMRKYATRQMQASDVDKPASSSYNNGIGYEYKPTYGKAQAMPSFEKGGGTAQRGERIHNHTYKSPAYARQMSYRGLNRNTYNPQEQKAIIKDGLDSAGMKYNGRNYMQLSDAYDREEEALNYLVDNIVYGSNADDDLIGSWVTRQDAGMREMLVPRWETFKFSISMWEFTKSK